MMRIFSFRNQYRCFEHKALNEFRSILVFGLTLSVCIGYAQVPESDRLSREPLYVFKDGNFYQVVNELPELNNSDTVATNNYGVKCTHYLYVNRPIKKTKKIKRVIVVGIENDSSMQLPIGVYDQIQEIRIYSSEYQQFLPTDIGKLINLRYLTVDFGLGENCGGFNSEQKEFPWRAGQLTTLTKLEQIHVSGSWINPLEIKSMNLQHLVLSYEMFSPYVVASLLPLQSVTLSSTGTISQRFIHDLTFYIYLPNAYIKHSCFSKIDSLRIGANRFRYLFYDSNDILIAETFVNAGRADSTWSFYSIDGKSVVAFTKFKNDTVLEYQETYGMSDLVFSTKKESFRNSLLVSSENYFVDSVLTKSVYHFDNWSTVVVREFEKGKTLPVRITIYKQGQESRVLTADAPELVPYHSYFKE